MLRGRVFLHLLLLVVATNAQLGQRIRQFSQRFQNVGMIVNPTSPEARASKMSGRDAPPAP